MMFAAVTLILAVAIAVAVVAITDGSDVIITQLNSAIPTSSSPSPLAVYLNPCTSRAAMAFDPSISTSGLSRSFGEADSDGSSSSADPTAPLVRYLTSGQPESFFERLYASEAAALGLFRYVLGRG